ncbi:MAG: hypothetical protein HND58_16640 [Planctomycetota bacterium]|nr:MAG: hypothetical protein HND58_16640 [Planctomycetota bacterium]
MGIFRKKPKTEAPGVAEVDFATLAAEAAAGTKTQNDLWGAVYDLPQWHFIGHGEMPNTRPLTGSIDGTSYLFAFTDEKLAHQAALHNGITVNGAFAGISMATPSAALYAARHLDTGVQGLMFNHVPGRQGFFTPLSNTLAQYQWFKGRLPAEVDPDILRTAFDFKTAVEAARRAGEERFRAIVITALLLDRWIVWGDESTPYKADADGVARVCMFTDGRSAERAEHAIFQSRGTAAPGRFDIDLSHGLDPIRRLQELGFAAVTINPLGGELQLPLGECLRIMEQLRQK